MHPCQFQETDYVGLSWAWKPVTGIWVLLQIAFLYRRDVRGRAKIFEYGDGANQGYPGTAGIGMIIRH